MNRDTSYSSGIFDLIEPLTIVLPDPGDRFQSMTVSNEHHYIKKTIYDPGEYTFTMDDIGSRYIQVTVRTFVIANSIEDNMIVSSLQDQIVVKQKSTGRFEIPDWDARSHEETRSHLLGLVKGIPNSRNMFGDEDEVNPIRHLIGPAAGYGGISEEHATYSNIYSENNDGKTAYILKAPKDMPADAFWSISVYNQKGYFQKNEIESYYYNNITALKNKDGSITIHFDGDANRINYIPICPGRSYNIRLYRPRQEILDGSWIFHMSQQLN